MKRVPPTCVLSTIDWPGGAIGRVSPRQVVLQFAAEKSRRQHRGKCKSVLYFVHSWLTDSADSIQEEFIRQFN